MNRREQSLSALSGHDPWAQGQIDRLRDRYRREGLTGLHAEAADLLAHVTEDQAADLLTEAVLTMTEQPGPRAAGRRDWAHFDADEDRTEAQQTEQGGNR